MLCPCLELACERWQVSQYALEVTVLMGVTTCMWEGELCQHVGGHQ